MLADPREATEQSDRSGEGHLMCCLRRGTDGQHSTERLQRPAISDEPCRDPRLEADGDRPLAPRLSLFASRR